MNKRSSVEFQWLRALIPWFEVLAGQELSPTSPFREEMEMFLFDIFGRQIISELFSIIVGKERE